MLAFDLHGGEPRWQGRTGHDVLRADRAGRGIEIHEVAAPHIDGADAETHAAGVDTIEIDQLFERRPETAGIVSAGSLNGSGRMQPRRWRSRREEPGRATHQSDIGADLVQPLPRNIALCHKQVLTPITPRFGGDALPERTQLADTFFRRVTCNQRPVDGADRDAGDPVWMKIGLRQCLIDPSLISTECTTPLEEERDAAERRMRPRLRSRIAGVR
jgi:hypothetical protein